MTAERFRDFKSKMVTRWISKKHERSRKTKKVKTGNDGADESNVS